MRGHTRSHDASVIQAGAGDTRSNDIGRNTVLGTNEVGSDRLRIKTRNEQGGGSGRIYHKKISKLSKLIAKRLTVRIEHGGEDEREG